MMDIQIRRLNRAGIREMSEFHRRIYRDNSTEDPPMHLLDDEEFSSSFVPPVPSSLVVDSSRKFDGRGHSAAVYYVLCERQISLWG